MGPDVYAKHSSDTLKILLVFSCFDAARQQQGTQMTGLIATQPKHPASVFGII
jgi:hypothetical protein